jgi:hypothetical protein
MQAGWLYLTIDDLANMAPVEINTLIIELGKKKEEIKEQGKKPSKEEFERQIEELIKQGKLDKKFLKEK